MAIELKSPSSPKKVFPPHERMYRWTVKQYQQMIAAGILGEKDRVELLEGWLVAKMTHNPKHDGTIQLLQSELEPFLPPGWFIRIQSAITLGKSEPEPDLALVRGPIRKYMQAHPGPADIGVIMEVSDSTFMEDRELKGTIYSRALIPIYWLVNISEAQIEVYSEPHGGRKAGYANRQDYRLADKIPLILDSREVGQISVHDLLP